MFVTLPGARFGSAAVLKLLTQKTLALSTNSQNFIGRLGKSGHSLFHQSETARRFSHELLVHRLIILELAARRVLRTYASAIPKGSPSKRKQECKMPTIVETK
jgi:hypothetical protein